MIKAVSRERTTPRFKVRFWDSKYFFPLEVQGQITDFQMFVYLGLEKIYGEFPAITECEEFMLFDRDYLHIPTAEVLDALPNGSEIIFVPAWVGRPTQGM